MTNLKELKKMLKSMKQEDENYKIIVTTQHAGQACWNGGEYREGFDLIPQEGEYFIKKHWSSADFAMCPVTGLYNDCSSCNRKWCERGEFEREEIEEVAEMLLEYGYERNQGALEVDTTGHEYTPCNHGGGCIVCHPCNHVSCADKIEEA